MRNHRSRRQPGIPFIMGVLNVTPDSFSDGGDFIDQQAAVARGLEMLGNGADVIDIGGESTRPGAAPVDAAEEMRRVIPVIKALREQTAARISIDTCKPEVARAAIGAGADIWNDVMALRAEGAIEAAAELGVPVILMHMAGTPTTMQQAPRYDDVVSDVCDFLTERADIAMAGGVDAGSIWLDPGIGFGKSLDHNLALMHDLDQVIALGYPVLFGASRKRFIAAIDEGAAETERLGGSLAAALRAAQAGASMVRVHDIRMTLQALKVQAAIREGRA
ncbi:dihydropteroate synthase [Maricaulis salignorans]|uniref:Dihydropteroate synthase n=1 Tax=Maricaulis salignorans TaxID=144026 RepID=A0A1G9UQN2_9PROT|nr:dihydropteroate synthase [Maricaulis salignorans]SDM62190.1 Dihydropteroate synthase [Maricaulis salignorans]